MGIADISIEIEKEITKSPKRAILKDKTGEILITKLELYVEPVRAIREARADNRDKNSYNFGDLSVEESSDEEDATPVKEAEVFVAEKKQKKQKKQVVEEDLDSLLADFGVKVEVEEKKVVVQKPKKEKKPVEEKKVEEKDETKVDGEKKKNKNKSSHMADMKRDIQERKDALAKKERKKGGM